MVRLRSIIYKKSSYEQANVFSKFAFWWLVKFFVEFQDKKLKTSDLEKCPKNEESERIGDTLERKWNEELRRAKESGRQPRLGLAITRTFGLRYSFTFILLALSTACSIIQTLCMGSLINDVYTLTLHDVKPEIVKRRIYLAGIGVIVTQFLGSFVQNLYLFLARKFGIAARVACSVLIYRKSLRLSQKALGQTTVGQIVNLLTNDITRFDFASEYPFYLIVAPIQALVCIYIMWPLLGISTVVGLAVFLFYVPFQSIMGHAFAKLRLWGALRMDERIRLMNEFIPAMRVIKMYAWEKSFAGLVDRARRREINCVRCAAFLRGLNLGLGTVAEKLIMFVTLVTFVLLGNRLTAETVFVSMALIRQLQQSITVFIPAAITMGCESWITIGRIAKFLLLPERESSEPIGRSISSSKETKVVFEKVSASWKDSPDELCLQNISFDISRGQLMAIVGTVGSGKSSLLMAILGEIGIVTGKSEVRGNLSFACQQSWIFEGSVRENILFGRSYEEERYKRVIEVSALERDLSILPMGDETLVGDKGTSLSGGQRARVNLARCLYAKADIYLLDDPLSAVDAPVAKHIFEKSIKNYLGDKITILVTHQLQFVKSADKVLLLKGGKQICFGDYNSFLKEGSEFTSSNKILQLESQDDSNIARPPIPLLRRLSRQSSRLSDITAGSVMTLPEMPDEPPVAPDDDSDEIPLADQTIQELAGVRGSEHPLWTYFKAGIHPLLFPLLAFYVIGAQALIGFVEYYFSLWSDSEERKARAADEAAELGLNDTDATFKPINFVDRFTQDDNIYFFTVLTIGIFIWCLTRNIAFFAVCMKASVKLHDRLFKAIVRAPIGFFDTNPIGIVLNRISRDMGFIDDFLPSSLFDTIYIFSNNLASIVLMAVVNPWLLLPAFLLLIACVFVRSRYVNIALDTKRLEGVTKSPVFSHLSTSVYGLSTIRAFRAQEKFKMIFDMYQDEHTSAYFTWLASTRFFVAAINGLLVIFTGLIVFTVLIALDSLTGSSVGLIITSTFGIASLTQWGMRQLTEVETLLTSVERIDELQYVRPEAELEATFDKKPPPNWPQQGQITFRHVFLRYDPAKPPVLNDLTFRIEPGEKIGIVGRTGAGKSSIMSALFRLNEPEGHIYIDGIDISTIGLHDLRRKISIIPQEPVIFTGTMRYNLDPFSLRKDAELWDSLEQVQLRKPVNDMGGLDAMITDGGSNLSVGQRQLVCLARAILAGNKILVLDEATANIDPTTDELIQQTIREKFTNCTVLTIAHRLHTIMDSDKILVMDAGQVVQFGEPADLIEDKLGHLYPMVQATGGRTAESLVQIAMKNRRRRESITESAGHNDCCGIDS
ncbi:multidrug resistance-associated protein 4 [Tetranychus urticae]|uniref:Uncharacterized protein n=1 Tax=Tetranychus urticae TaxID=32264 RepID=T1KW02_TETUR|nr:multidrug resistance-associated protein 4 [Tetranychus urticae]XP_025017782.1 multidrug resistance-associated protein 4 [Tetranychus urticae]